MTSPTYYTDGSPGFGTTSLTINAVTYIAENVRINRPVKEAQQYTALGAPGQKRVTTDWAHGTATLQISSGTSGRPKMGDTFSYTTDDNFGAETFVLKMVDYEAENDAGTLRKLPITFDKAYGTITPVA